MATPTTLPASFTAGNVLTAAQMNDLRGAFRVLQIVSGSNSTETSTTSSSYQTTNVTASITPSATSSKVLAFMTGSFGGATDLSQMYSAIFRGTTAGTQLVENVMYSKSTTGYYGPSSLIYLDSPSTTSATTYTVAFRSGGGAMVAYAQRLNTATNLILMEISA